MKIVYLGTPEFSVRPLKTLSERKDVEIIAVVCNKDKPFGRKQILTPPPVKVFAESLGVPVYQYGKIRAEGVEDLKKLDPDLMITCAFGQILSQEILDIPKLGVFNIHASLLPKHRGASPINYAILNGEKTTGITIMKTDKGIDTGDVLFSEPLDILPNENAGELSERLSVLGAECINKALDMIISGKYTLTKQAEEYATYTKMIRKEDALINFNDSAENVVNKIRAFAPSPAAFTYYNGEPFKIYSAEKAELKGICGAVLDNGKRLVIATADASVSLLTVCKAGGKIMSAQDFLRGNKPQIGSLFG